MTTQGLLRHIVGALDTAGIPYMLTGSLASAYHGAGRSTMDIDVVIDPTADSLRALLSALPADTFYVSREAADIALRDRGQFNVIEIASGWKFDLIIRKDTAFAECEFARRIQGEVDGVPLSVTSLEDVILAKLAWARQGESARQIEDVAALVRVRGSELDMPYVERWLSALGVQAEWRAATIRPGRTARPE